MRGSRVQAVVNELQGEKIDIIQWSPDSATFIVNALAPAEVVKVVLDEDSRRIEVVVPDDQLSLAIGRRGQNVRLASQLTGWDIDILTEAEESQRRQEEFRQRSEMFARDLDVEETIAQLLAAEGFSSIEEVAFVPEDELIDIQGFDEDLAGALQARAREKIEQRDAAFEAERLELGVGDDVAALPGLTPAMLVDLGRAGVKTLDDVADLATDELIDPKDGILRTHGLGAEDAQAVIMAARAHWFDGEDGAAAPTEAHGSGDGTLAAPDHIA
jgi:N utilization substance protein A